MSQKDHLAIFPSRANAVAMKTRIHSTTHGLILLKKKRDAIEIKLRELREEAHDVSDCVRPLLIEAYMALSHARYLGADLEVLKETRPKSASAYCMISISRQVGISMPLLSLVIEQSNDFALSSMGRGGTALRQARLQFQAVLEKIIKVAALQHSIDLLTGALHENNMRVNGVEFCVLPLLVNTEKYILNELDELEREDFYRLKCSKAKQEKLREERRQLVMEVNHGDPFAFVENNPVSVFNIEAFNEKLTTSRMEPIEEEKPPVPAVNPLKPDRERDPYWEFWTFSSTYLLSVDGKDTSTRRHVKRRKNLIKMDGEVQTDFVDETLDDLPDRR